jgi:hypothetical protein
LDKVPLLFVAQMKHHDSKFDGLVVLCASEVRPVAALDAALRRTQTTQALRHLTPAICFLNYQEGIGDGT